MLLEPILYIRNPLVVQIYVLIDRKGQQALFVQHLEISFSNSRSHRHRPYRWRKEYPTRRSFSSVNVSHEIIDTLVEVLIEYFVPCHFILFLWAKTSLTSKVVGRPIRTTSPEDLPAAPETARFLCSRSETAAANRHNDIDNRR